MNRKYMTDVFSKSIMENFRYHCRTIQEEVNINNLLTYLIDIEIINDSAIKHFVIQNEYTSELINLEKNKTSKVQYLASKFNMSERSIWSIIKTKQI